MSDAGLSAPCGEGSEEPGRKPRPRLLWSLAVLAVLVLAALAFALVLRWQWDRHLEGTRAWYEEQVGPLDPEVYLREPVPEEENLGRALLELAAEAEVRSAETEPLRRFGWRYLGIAVREAEQGPPTEEELRLARDAAEELEELLDGLRALEPLSRVRLRERVETLEELSQQDWLPVFSLFQTRLGQVALALHDGACFEAGEQAVALARIAGASGSESALMPALQGVVTQRMLLEAVQRLAERELLAECDPSSRADLERLRDLLAWVHGIRAPLERVWAAEASLQDRLFFRSAGDGRETSPAARLLGSNLFGLRSELLRAWAEVVLENRDVEEGVPAPELGPPASWLGTNDVLARVALPNMRDLAARNRRLADVRRLTRWALDVAICSRLGECEAADLEPPTSAATGDPAEVHPVAASEGVVAVTLAGTVPEDHWAEEALRETLTVRVPADLLETAGASSE